MSRALVILYDDVARARAAAWVRNAPRGTRLEFKGPKRTLDQNALMWVLLTEVSRQGMHHGIRLSPDDWKLIFLDALKREVRMVPNLDGNGLVSLGRSSSDLSKEEMGELIELIYAWGAQHGIDFDAAREGAAPNKPAPVAA